MGRKESTKQLTSFMCENSESGPRLHADTIYAYDSTRGPTRFLA